MPILGTLIKKGIKIREGLEQEVLGATELQQGQLKKLLISANYTAFGQAYDFRDLLDHAYNPRSLYEKFQSQVPTHTYAQMFSKWWHLSHEGKRDICWPGRVKYFALSSGTSDASSKYIPITRDMVKAIRKTSLRQIISLSKYDLPTKFFQGGILMVGGSTHLHQRGNFFEGDLSGIQAAQLPFWFQHFYKPGKRIAKERDWDSKLNDIVRNASKWDIAIIVGVPAWIQILMEKIIAHYKVNHIHDIWPNLEVYVHGGVAFDPYRKGFVRLLGRPIHYIETYLASEGFLAFQAYPDRTSMRLVLNNGIFYEFVPFNESNFDEDGDLKPDAETMMIDEVEEGKQYALLLSTCAGAWRYLIGDVIKFISLENSEIVITGRTKHFLSLCGEHLSVDNMNNAIRLVADELNVNVKEFTVAGVHHESLFAHKWYLGIDDPVDKELFRNRLDDTLKELNDDYKVERSAALKEIFVEVLPVQKFYDWMRLKGKEGGQNKFPRVMKKAVLEDWLNFLNQ